MEFTMSPLPPNNTPRFKFNYTVNSTDHSFILRDHGSPSAVGTIVDDFLTALTDALYELTINTVEFAADGSNIFLPVTTGIENNVYSTGSAGNPGANWFYGFIGRSAGGRRWHLDIFGARTLGTDFRLVPGENGDVDNAVTELTLATSLVGIDDLSLSIYPYVNCGDNAHWQRAVRP